MGRYSQTGILCLTSKVGRMTPINVSGSWIRHQTLYSHPDLTAAITSWGEGWVIMRWTGISCTGGSLVTTLLPAPRFVPGFVSAQFVKTFENHPRPLFGSWKQLNLTSSSLLRLNSAIYSRGVTAPCCFKLLHKKSAFAFYKALVPLWNSKFEYYQEASTILQHGDIRGVDSVLLPVGIILKITSIFKINLAINSKSHMHSLQ